MNGNNSIIISWLNNAYAMEENLVRVLQKHAEDAEDYPQVQSKIKQHIDVTKIHAERVRKRIEDLGGEVSDVKAKVGSITGAVTGMATGMAEDAVIKNALAEFSSENMEIASYKSLMAAAEAKGDTETATMAQEILQDEQEMAAWLDEHIPILTREFITEKEPVATKG